MTHKKKDHGKHGEPHAPAKEHAVEPAAEPVIPEGAPATPHGVGLVERSDEEIARLTEQLEQAKDQHLRLAAEYENFRKRTARERGELRARSQAEVVANILDSLDDLGRVAHLDPSAVSAKDIVTGVELAERKMLRELETAGLERVGNVGEKFDPNAHEAISSMPAPTAEADHTVAAVFQPGYRFGGALIRPARVQVFLWQGAQPATPTDG
ncbi:MAG TPA: nucleotide exchange factor GrpE [Gemmatimonadales bacterium]